jgi:Lrp/AsnC family transcriptional regulator, leucine-responsive regulatory protein
MSQDRLDRTDRNILEVLQRDGRIANVALANQVHLSPAPCLRRVAALEQAGIIERYVALLNARKLGLGLLAFVSVKLIKGGKMPSEQFGIAVAAWSEVVACYALTGDMDYLLRVHVPDLERYNAFMSDKLLRFAGLVDVRSSIVLDRVKETTALPIQHLLA